MTSLIFSRLTVQCHGAGKTDLEQLWKDWNRRVGSQSFIRGAEEEKEPLEVDVSRLDYFHKNLAKEVPCSKEMQVLCQG